MLVTMINGGDPHHPAAGRLRAALEPAGVDVERVTPADAPRKAGLYSRIRRYNIRVRMPRAVEARYGGFTTDYTDDSWRMIRGLRQKLMGDIVHLFDVDGGFDPETDGFLDWWTTIPLLMKHVPVVWTMTEMNPFTGGCHNDAGCGRFVDRCGCCPALDSKWELDDSRHVIERKTHALSARAAAGLVVVTPTQWLGTKSKASRVFGRFDHRVIGPAVDTGLFSPDGRAAASAKLDRAGPVVFVSPDTPSAVTRIKAVMARIPSAVFVSVGPMKLNDPRVVELGPTRGDHAVAEHLPAADVALIDAGPAVAINFAAEAMSCGVPVVGVDDFGLNEFVTDGATGRLVRGNDPTELAAAVSALLDDELSRRRMSAAARAVAVAKFDLVEQGRAYRDLYLQTTVKLAGTM